MGDYSTTPLDPVDPRRSWTIQMYPIDPQTWRTRITQLLTSLPRGRKEEGRKMGMATASARLTGHNHPHYSRLSCFAELRPKVVAANIQESYSTSAIGPRQPRARDDRPPCRHRSRRGARCKPCQDCCRVGSFAHPSTSRRLPSRL